MNTVLPAFLTKFSSTLSARTLLSGTLPAFLVLIYVTLIIARLTGSPILDIWGDSLRSTTAVAGLALIVLTLLLDNLNPLFSSWLCGDAPWIRRSRMQRELERKQTAYGNLVSWTARLDTWRQHANQWNTSMEKAIARIKDTATTDSSRDQSESPASNRQFFGFGINSDALTRLKSLILSRIFILRYYSEYRCIDRCKDDR
jgi:hypothetical protein